MFLQAWVISPFSVNARRFFFLSFSAFLPKKNYQFHNVDTPTKNLTVAKLCYCSADIPHNKLRFNPFAFSHFRSSFALLSSPCQRISKNSVALTTDTLWLKENRYEGILKKEERTSDGEKLKAEHQLQYLHIQIHYKHYSFTIVVTM